jgi:hypothetical protein
MITMGNLESADGHTEQLKEETLPKSVLRWSPQGRGRSDVRPYASEGHVNSVTSPLRKMDVWKMEIGRVDYC